MRAGHRSGRRYAACRPVATGRCEGGSPACRQHVHLDLFLGGRTRRIGLLVPSAARLPGPNSHQQASSGPPQRPIRHAGALAATLSVGQGTITPSAARQSPLIRRSHRTPRVSACRTKIGTIDGPVTPSLRLHPCHAPAVPPADQYGSQSGAATSGAGRERGRRSSTARHASERGRVTFRRAMSSYC